MDNKNLLELISAAQQWNIEKRQEIILEFSEFIKKKAIKIWREVDDITQEWILWLNEAINRFDETKSINFKNYAWMYILNAMHSFLSKNTTFITMPHNFGTDINLYLLSLQKYYDEYWTDPSMLELQSMLWRWKVRFNNISWMVNWYYIYSDSYSETNWNYSKENFINTLSSGADMCGDLTTKYKINAVKGFIKYLNDIEKDIFISRRQWDTTLTTLSNKYNISRERVRQIENRVLNKIKTTIWPILQ